MTFSEASEREPTFEAKEEKNKEIGEIKPETRDASETATLVNNAHNEPEVLVELEGNIEQAEAIESAVVKTVEAPVAFVERVVEAAAAVVDQALEAAAAEQEQSGVEQLTEIQKDAIDTADQEAASDGLADAEVEAIDQASTAVLSAASGENAETTGTEDGGDAAIDTVPLPEQPAKMESAEAIIDPKDSPSATDRVDSAAIIDSNDSPRATEKLDSAAVIDPNDSTRIAEASDPAAIIDSNDGPSDISASEVIETEAESVAIGSRSTPEEPADDVLRGPGGQKNTGEFDDKAIDVGGIGKEAFVNPNEFLVPQEGLDDLSVIGSDGISDMGLDLGSISELLFGASDMTPDDLRNDAFPDLQFGKSGDEVLDAGSSVGDTRLGVGVKITDEMTDYMDSNGNQTITRHETYETDTETTTIVSTVKDSVATQTITVENKATGDTYTETSIDGVPPGDDGESPAPPDESTPDPEGAGPTTKAGAKFKEEIESAFTFTSPSFDQGGQEGIMQPSGEGGDFDEDRTLPISLEKALNTRLDPWTNWEDGSELPGGMSFIEELKPQVLNGDSEDPGL